MVFKTVVNFIRGRRRRYQKKQEVQTREQTQLLTSHSQAQDGSQPRTPFLSEEFLASDRQQHGLDPPLPDVGDSPAFIVCNCPTSWMGDGICEKHTLYAGTSK